MEKKTYSEKLKDPRWQKKRLEVLNRDEWVCQRCQDNETTLHVHHLSYEAGKEPWEYELDAFITLCECCHEQEKETRPEYEKMLTNILKSKGFMADDVYVITAGFLRLRLQYPPDVTSSIIEYALGNEEVFSVLSSMYFEHVKQLAERRREAKNES